MISVFDIFKIGIGPSSSHTVGPMKAGKQFTDDLIARNLLKDVTRVVVDVYGSLSLTGKGHHTDIAIIMGLAGNLPDTVDIDSIPGFIQDVNTHGRLMLANGQHEVEFPVDQCMNFHADNLLCMKTVCALPRWRAIKSFTARLTTLLAVALSLMKSILASRIAHRLKFLIRTVQQPICKNIVRKPGCHSLA